MEYVKVEAEYLQKLKENEENLIKAVELIIDELKTEESNDEKIQNIADYIEDLQEVLHYI